MTPMLETLRESISSVSAPLGRFSHVTSMRAVTGTALIACALGCPTYSPAAEASTETVLYSFGSSATDGLNPDANFINVGGTLYGTTPYGGSGNCNSGCGTVFSFNLQTGAETVLYSFQNNGTDGAYPPAGLINIKGTLYSTTSGGGTYGVGTVFSFNPGTDAESVLYSFGSGTDGTYPAAGLIQVNGMLYGTTNEGGSSKNCGYGCGAVFSLQRKTHAETVLYSFQDYPTDGSNPYAGLIDVDGTLYGTTYSGGTSSNCSNGCGTVFSVNPKSGNETILHSFSSYGDGAYVLAGLINDKGTLYGTTALGGDLSGCNGEGCGTIFSINPQTGAETVLYSFVNGIDAQQPWAGLIKVGGKLFGTTQSGGTYNAGTVFSYDLKTGTEKVLHSFGNGEDGQQPEAGLLDVKGTLYGTTYGGGTYGNGTVFSVVP